VTLLAGGVGGARLAAGIARAHLAPGAADRGPAVLDAAPGDPDATPVDLTVVVNTGDDAEIHGLWVSPDLDTVMYTLAGRENRAQGWGLEGETFTVHEALGALGVDTWFLLGDQDLATHLARTAARRAGEPLSTTTARLAAALGVPARLLPVTDDRLATVVDTPDGTLEFQEYFVRRRHADPVRDVRFEGADAARPAPGVLEAVSDTDLVVLAPSNPVLSIGPLLAVPGVRAALEARTAPCVAVSPIIGGRALKGPAADVLAALGHEPSARGVARMYLGLVDVLVVDHADADLRADVEALGMQVVVTDAVMGDRPGRARLAREVLAAAGGPPS
jgi:LPPG:FO 2-phospho-L-lactate transferase